jgi:hypothetical protein
VVTIGQFCFVESRATLNGARNLVQTTLAGCAIERGSAAHYRKLELKIAADILFAGGLVEWELGGRAARLERVAK